MLTLNHIGIAVADLPQLRRLFDLLGLPIRHSEPVPEQGVTTHFIPVLPDPSHGANLELLEISDPTGTVAKFVQKRGPGVHHLSFTVKRGELDPLCDKLRAEGFKLTYESARNGAHDMRINFIHPASAGGLLIEIMESASG